MVTDIFEAVRNWKALKDMPIARNKSKLKTDGLR